MGKFVILGAGAAGIAAAQSIRSEDKEIQIEIYSEENINPYYTPQTIRYIEGNTPLIKLFIKQLDWYDKNNVTLNLNTKVSKIEPENKLVRFNNGKATNYDKLLIATGGKSIRIPIDGAESKQGIFTLKTVMDVDNIVSYLKDVNKICIIGAGFIGIEAAFSLVKLGKKVTLVEYSKKLLPRYIDDYTSNILKEQLDDYGIELRLGQSVLQIKGYERVEGVKFSDLQESECQMIIMAVGIKPCINFIEGTSIAFGRGIKVNEYMQTNVDNVYAAGDVAEVNDVPCGLWSTAQEHGKIAGFNMIGQNISFNNVPPSFMMNAGMIKLFSMGIINDTNNEYEVILDNLPEKNIYRKYIFKDGIIIGAIIINDIAKNNIIKNAILNNVDKTALDF